jgi:hypothetical protein
MVYTRRGLEGSDALPDLPTTRSSKAIASSALKILGSFIVEPKAIRSLPYPFFKRRYHYWDCVFEFPEIVICTVRMSSNEVCKAQCLTDLFVKPLLALLKGFGIADLIVQRPFDRRAFKKGTGYRRCPRRHRPRVVDRQPGATRKLSPRKSKFQPMSFCNQKVPLRVCANATPRKH